MAIYSFNMGVVSRGYGQSVVAAAAYRHRAAMTSQFTGVRHDYSSRDDCVAAGLVLPKNAPPWAVALKELPPHLSSEKLWNALEASEKRCDASLAYSLMVALPREFGRMELASAAHNLARQFSARFASCVDYVVHTDAANHNPHAHFLIPQRPLSENGFGPKRKPLLDVDGLPKLDRFGRQVHIRHHGFGWRELLSRLREVVADILTRHLRRLGFPFELSGDSYRSRGIVIPPGTHIGPTVHAPAQVRSHARRLRNDASRKERARYFLDRPLALSETLGFHRSTFQDADIHEAVAKLPLPIPDALSLSTKVKSMTPRSPQGGYMSPTRALEHRSVNASISFFKRVSGRPTLLHVESLPPETTSATRYATPLGVASKTPGSVVVVEDVDLWPAAKLDALLRSLPKSTETFLGYSTTPAIQKLRDAGASILPSNIETLEYNARREEPSLRTGSLTEEPYFPLQRESDSARRTLSLPREDSSLNGPGPYDEPEFGE